MLQRRDAILGLVLLASIVVSLQFANSVVGQADASNTEATSQEPDVQKNNSDLASKPGDDQEKVIEQVRDDGAKLEELLSLVSDNSFRIHKREMPAYWMLIDQVNHEPIEQLLGKSKVNPRFHDLYTAPSKHRGDLVQIVLNVRRVIPYPIEVENSAGVKKLYELWGWTDEAKAWLYCCITSELPPGFPESGEVIEKATLVGYFFKLQAYQPGGAAPNAKPLVAPLILGRVVWKNAKEDESSSSPNWLVYLVCGFGVLVAFRVLMQVRSMTKPTRTRSMYRRRSLEPIDTEALSLSLGRDEEDKNPFR